MEFLFFCCKGKPEDGVFKLCEHLGYKPDEYKMGKYEWSFISKPQWMIWWRDEDKAIFTYWCFINRFNRRTKIFIRNPQTLFATEDLFQNKKHYLGRNQTSDVFLWELVLWEGGKGGLSPPLRGGALWPPPLSYCWLGKTLKRNVTPFNENNTAPSWIEHLLLSPKATLCRGVNPGPISAKFWYEDLQNRVQCLFLQRRLSRHDIVVIAQRNITRSLEWPLPSLLPTGAGCVLRDSEKGESEPLQPSESMSIC